jgi:hypothetical protein
MFPEGVFPIASTERLALGDRSRASVEAVLFFTHEFDQAIEIRYRKLKLDLGERAKLFILAPLGSPIPQDYSDGTYFFDYGRLRSEAKRVIGDQLLPGNVHLVALDFYRHHPGFDYYWFIEYDVVFTGSWATLMDAVANDRADLLAGHVRNLAEEPGWPWWKTLDLPGCTLPRSSWVRAFFPVYRISREGLRVVEEYVRLGWSGHFEGLVPCAICSASLTIADLGGAGKWTPRDRRHRFYSSYSSDAGASLNAGTLRHRPPHYLPRFRRNTIFHPVKAGHSSRESGVIQFLRNQHLRELLVRCAASLYYNLLSLWSVLRKDEK